MKCASTNNTIMMAETRKKEDSNYAIKTLISTWISTAETATHPSDCKGVTNYTNKDIKNTIKILELLL
jgi:hypothetical protein